MDYFLQYSCRYKRTSALNSLVHHSVSFTLENQCLVVRTALPVPLGSRRGDPGGVSCSGGELPLHSEQSKNQTVLHLTQ